MERLVVISTHPNQYTGYAKVGYNLIKRLAQKNPECAISWYGFQKSANKILRELPENVTLYDAESDEEDIFGVKGIQRFIKLTQPNVILLYNDPQVVNQFIHAIIQVKKESCKICLYLDLVYPHMNKTLIKNSVSKCNDVAVFSNTSNKTFQNDANVIPHGLDDSSVFIMNQADAKKMIGIDTHKLILLNMNRNEKRKRYDIFIKAIVLYLKNVKELNLVVLIGTNIESSWKLKELYDIEANENSVDYKWEDVFVYVGNAQSLDDKVVNYIYNAADIGINTCDGEGFGLCNGEHASLGKPQILSNLDVFKEIYEDDVLYGETAVECYKNDVLGGRTRICTPESFAKCIEVYVNDENKRKNDGYKLRERMKKYTWENAANLMNNFLMNIL